MTDDEYREFLTFVFERYVRPRIPRLRNRFHHHMMEEWYHHLDQARRAVHVVRFIESQCDHDDEVYQTFTLERLARAVSDTRYTLDFGNRAMDESGLFDAFDSHAREMLEGLKPQHLPEADREVLREMGSPNPDLEIRALVLRVRSLQGQLERSLRELSISQQLHHAEEQLAQAQKEFDATVQVRKQKQDDTTERPKKSRRWFKGLGQMGQGAALSIANIALAIGAIHFPVSPETQTWGAVASVTTGIGTIFGGVGDLRNE